MFKATRDFTLPTTITGSEAGRAIQDKKVAVGVVDHRNLQVERPEQVAALIRKALKHISQEEGFKAIPRAGHVPHDHSELIFRFCRTAGLSEADVRAIKLTPAWWARALHYYQTAVQEPIGVVLAMQSTQEGQQPALNTEVVLPAFAKHYGYPAGSPEIEFFTEHAEADVEHSQRQATLCAKYLDSDAAKARALEVAEQACMLRWASITDLYRREYLGEKEILPSGVD